MHHFLREGGHGSRCSHSECGHYLSALYPAVTCSVCAAPVRTWHVDNIFTAPCWLRNDRSHGPDSADVRVRAVLVQGW